ncbi:hypothetical protein EDB89DRAFT_1907729 [Lactarius sanguifluus]|nr:hypothetical protein EDB89DRAFT_1907729 [Lactarius sanguifluus]
MSEWTIHKWDQLQWLVNHTDTAANNLFVEITIVFSKSRQQPVHSGCRIFKDRLNSVRAGSSRSTIELQRVVAVIIAAVIATAVITAAVVATFIITAVVIIIATVVVINVVAHVVIVAIVACVVVIAIIILVVIVAIVVLIVIVATELSSESRLSSESSITIIARVVLIAMSSKCRLSQVVLVAMSSESVVIVVIVARVALVTMLSESVIVVVNPSLLLWLIVVVGMVMAAVAVVDGVGRLPTTAVAHIVVATGSRRQWSSMCLVALAALLNDKDDDCFSVQLSGSDLSPRAPKVTILQQRFPMQQYNWENGGRLTNLAKDMDPFTSTSVNAMMQLIVTILQPHTSSPTLSIVTCAMTSLVTANIRGDNLDQLFSTHLNLLAISPQMKRAVIPALLGIAKLTEVCTQGTPIGPDQVSAAQELLGPKIGVAATAVPGGTYASYQSHQWPFSSSSGGGYTIWYFSWSDSSIQSPPMVPQSKTGHLYVHFNTSTKTHQYWMLGVGPLYLQQWGTKLGHLSNHKHDGYKEGEASKINSCNDPLPFHKLLFSQLDDLWPHIWLYTKPYQWMLEQFEPVLVPPPT